jgi:hypothetical protein
LYNPIAVEGDFASANPRASVLAGEGALVAGPGGVTSGRFGWVLPSTKADANGYFVTNFGQGGRVPDGFMRREPGQALITTYLAETSNVVPEGFMVTLFNAGDFFVIARGEAAVPGSAVYASYEDGTAWIGAAPTGASATGSVGSTFTATAGSGLNATNLTVTAVTGLISVGDTIAGTGVPTGTTIISQTSGTTGGAGVYVTSVATTASAATVTSFGTVLNVSAVGSGTLEVGDAITGTGIPTGASIESQVSGAVGGVGVYTLNIPATAYAASTALTLPGGILTKWVAKSVAAVGELVKISTWGN